jgi:hypothetical protein
MNSTIQKTTNTYYTIKFYNEEGHWQFFDGPHKPMEYASQAEAEKKVEYVFKEISSIRSAGITQVDSVEFMYLKNTNN